MPAAAGIALGAAGLYQGYESSQDANKLGEQSLALQQQQLGFNQQRYNDYESLYGSLNQTLVNQAQQGVQADLSGATSRAEGDQAQAYANSQQALARQNAALGIAPDSGRAQANATMLGLNQAASTAGDVSQSREAERQWAQGQTLALRQNVNNAGIGLEENAAGGMQQSTAGMAGTYGNLEGQQANEAGQGYSGFANMLGLTYKNGLSGSSGTPSGLGSANLTMPNLSLGGNNADPNAGNSPYSGLAQALGLNPTTPPMSGL